MKEMMRLSVQLESELLTTVRLTTGGICSLAGLSLDDSEDCKVCVTEGLLLLLHSGFSDAEIFFFEEDGLCVKLVGGLREKTVQSSVEDEISYALLEALVSDLAMEKAGGALQAIIFRFRR